MKLHALGLATGLALFGGAAWSQAYIAAGAGLSRFDGPCGLVQCDNGGTAARVQLGLRLDGPWAVEVAYAHHGTRKGPDTAQGATDTRLSGLSVGGAWFTGPSPQWEAVVRAGVAHNRVRYREVVVTDLGGSFAVREIDQIRSEAHNTLYVGAGAAVRITPTVSLGADLDVTRHALFDRSITVATLLASLRPAF